MVSLIGRVFRQAREKLAPALPAAIAEEMVPTVQEVFGEHKLSEQFAQQVLQRIGHWECFGPREGWPATQDGKVGAVLDDPEWVRFTQMELEPLLAECRQIRKQIARPDLPVRNSRHAILARVLLGKVSARYVVTIGERDRADSMW